MKLICIFILAFIVSTESFAESDPNYYFSFGLLRARFASSDIHINQSSYNRDAVYRQVEGRDDLRLRKLHGYHITELQFYFRFGTHAVANWPLELSLYHLTYIVHGNQNVRKQGRWDGQVVDEVVEWGDDFRQFEHSNGLNVLAVNLVKPIVSYEIDPLKISFLYRIGPGLVIANSNNEVYDPNGNVEKYEPLKKLHLGGYSFQGGVASQIEFVENFYAEIAFEASYMDIRKFKLKVGDGHQKLLHALYTYQLGYRF